jgi:hypothetical protein
MPFVTKEHRDMPDLTIPGDICYLEYKKIIDEWKANPRWTTAHNITKKWFDIADDKDAAHLLAWMVWFNMHVMPYEEQKRKENGEVE